MTGLDPGIEAPALVAISGTSGGATSAWRVKDAGITAPAPRKDGSAARARQARMPLGGQARGHEERGKRSS